MNKAKLIDKVTIIFISATFIFLIVCIGIRIFNHKEGTSFEKEIQNIYSLLNKQFKSDEDNYFYVSTLVSKNKETYDYIAEFDKDTKNLKYLCISNGIKKIEIESENIDIELLKDNPNIKETSKRCEVKSGELDEK